MRKLRQIGITVLLAVSCVSCAASPSTAPARTLQPGTTPVATVAAKPQIAASTQVLADIVEHIVADTATVHATVPRGADPQHYAPLPQDLKHIATADVAFYNYQQYEDPRLVAAYTAHGNNAVELASEAVKHNAKLIPLITDNSLNTVWLGLQASGSSDPQASTKFVATKISGPGKLAAYIVSSFGQPKVLWAASEAVAEDFGTAELPANAHTHLSWAFTAPGIYRMQLVAQSSEEGAAAATAEVVFAVGVDPVTDPTLRDRTVIDSGHADIAYDASSGSLQLVGEISHEAGVHGSSHAHSHDLQLSLREVVIGVPSRALQAIPAGNYGFLGDTGELIYQLPQAVLGRSLHGEIDPHLLADPHNANSYVDAITEHLTRMMPQHSVTLRSNAAAYKQQLSAIAARQTAQHRDSRGTKQLITATNNQSYFASAYDYEIAATVRRNPAVEATLADRKKLLQAIKTGNIPAVFVDPQPTADSDLLRAVATTAGVPTCVLYDQVLDDVVTSYIELLEHNSETVTTCLQKENYDQQQ
ncbi:anchored repeat ABC transporter, substrate-binding protein [Canibacter oris]|uniref:Anchored repeat ABC transporter substrate-binding protein n=1 Tax=Canibacter oris TaxID=1365628 RepID=A0A840DIH8_9MICO|nr:anchored repeat ABC transporter substrate-binding protein [Canibacter oris]